MATVPVMFLQFFLLSVGIGDQQHNSNITLGSTLFPNTHPTSWFSPSGLFGFGFYRQGKGFAVGIWLTGKPESTVVWTANRDDPPVSSNATIEFTKDGWLLLRTNHGDEKPITDFPGPAVSASMLDSGNFVIQNRTQIIWESFDNPTDSILGGQNLYDVYLVSSKSTSDLSSGRFYLEKSDNGNLIAHPVNSTYVPDNSYWSTQTAGEIGLSLNLNKRGHLSLRSFDLNYTIANSSYHGSNKTIIYRATLDPDGNFRLYAHIFETSDNSTVLIEWSALKNQCEARGFCGVNSYCLSNGSIADCFCFPGFVFVYPDMRYLGCYQSFIDEQGCRRKEPKLLYNVTALENTTFLTYPYSVVLSMMKDDCSESCLEDCNCWAALYKSGNCSKHKLPLVYAVLNRSESVTAFVKMSSGNAQIADRNPPNIPSVVIESKKQLVVNLALSLGSLAFLFSLIAVFSFFIYRHRYHRYKKLSENADLGLSGDFTLRSFSYNDLEKATDGFKEELGRNSFGAVYKGALPDGNKIVAVKRLERVVEDGAREFRAEMTAIGRTHHRNLVRLIGFCMEGARKLLVYEFLTNGSLADLLFKDERRPVWKERVRIALDVARGILYLHEECEARIIHCNIKPQNILMDDSWTAKISDFGLAKLLMPNQTGTFTGIRGSRGYLAPEWHKNALISEKVDVYSFGVVLLEIVCCRSNMEVDVSTADEVLLSTWVYSCFVAKDLKNLVGDEEVDMSTLERMVKVGLLCIQDDPGLRPSMKNVILMLEGTMDIPIPASPTPCLVIT